MNIVKWILARPLVAIWVLGAIAILLAMASGNKKHEVANTHEVKSNVVETEKVVKKKAVQDEVSTTNTLPKVNDEQDVKAQNIIEKGTTKEPTIMQIEHNSTTPDVNSEPFLSNATEGEKSKKATNKVAVLAEDLSQLETDELLLMAREAYWNNGLDEAAQIYQQLIKREPQVIEHKGELGNVYWRQGYPKKAAELYSEIAIPLIESGSSERVSNMIGFIQLFYPDRVEVIMDRLERSSNRKNYSNGGK